jgi:hypothetical protein
MKTHEEFEQVCDGYEHRTFTKLLARRVIREGKFDEAQIEILLARTPTPGKRTTTLVSSFVLSPADAKRLALAICPELAAPVKQ